MPVHRRMGTDVQPLPAAGLNRHRPGGGTEQPRGDAVEGYGDTAVPWLAETAGFCGALLLVDWNSGHSISETIWDSPKTLAASHSVAARVRVETVKSTGCVIRALEEYNLVFNTARIGGV